jgi:hypothetical protein
MNSISRGWMAQRVGRREAGRGEFSRRILIAGGRDNMARQVRWRDEGVCRRKGVLHRGRGRRWWWNRLKSVCTRR